MKLSRSAWLGLLSIALISAVIISACNKESSSSSGNIPPGKQQVSVSLNDDPVPNLTSVIVDIRYVEVKVDTGREHHGDAFYDDDHEGEDGHHDGEDDHHRGDHFGKWDTLSITPGLYDLLKLKNGTDTLIASGFSHIGKITKIRITLGPNNSVATDSSHSFPLPICSTSPYVYANIRSGSLDSLGGGQYLIRIDFNVARSIEFENGKYCLRAKLKSYCLKTSGIIEGNVVPRASYATIMVFDNTDTAFAIPELSGDFKIRGLPEGTYSVLYNAVAPYKDTTLVNIKVQNGLETKLPAITLHQ